MDLIKVKEAYTAAEHHIKNVSIGCFEGRDKPIFMISREYPGVWLEHLYDSVLLSKLYPEDTVYMENIFGMYFEGQRDSGQLPFVIWNKAFLRDKTEPDVKYSQIQECVAFGRLCLEAYGITRDEKFLRDSYNATSAWVCWLESHRMTRGMGLIELFCGYDCGHDNSGRIKDFPVQILQDGKAQDADFLPPENDFTPMIAVDMNCNFFGNLAALSEMANLLGDKEASKMWIRKAENVKKRLFEVCFDKDDCFFYDIKKNGEPVKVKSSTLFHLFLEKVLDKEEDAKLIEELYRRHIKNPEEFWTEYPFPSVAYNDPTTAEHAPKNCWGYFCQMLIYLRCTRWMDYYGFGEDFDYILGKVVEVWTNNFDKIKFAQEFDPVTGKPTECSEWYSSCMLTYVYAVRRLELLK